MVNEAWSKVFPCIDTFNSRREEGGGIRAKYANFFSPSCPKILWGFLLLHMALEPIKIEKAKKTAVFEMLRAVSYLELLTWNRWNPSFWNLEFDCKKERYRNFICGLKSNENVSLRLELLASELWIHPYIVHQTRFRMLLSCQLSIQSALFLRQPKMYQVFCWWCWGKTSKIFFIHENKDFLRFWGKMKQSLMMFSIKYFVWICQIP